MKLTQILTALVLSTLLIGCGSTNDTNNNNDELRTEAPTEEEITSLTSGLSDSISASAATSDIDLSNIESTEEIEETANTVVGGSECSGGGTVSIAQGEVEEGEDGIAITATVDDCATEDESITTYGTLTATGSLSEEGCIVIGITTDAFVINQLELSTDDLEVTLCGGEDESEGLVANKAQEEESLSLAVTCSGIITFNLGTSEESCSVTEDCSGCEMLENDCSSEEEDGCGNPDDEEDDNGDDTDDTDDENPEEEAGSSFLESGDFDGDGVNECGVAECTGSFHCQQYLDEHPEEGDATTCTNGCCVE